MSATKILWGQILVVSVIVLAAVWGATQWTAWRLGYQSQLGTPWTELAGTPVYPSTGVLSLVVLVRRLRTANLC